MPNTQGKAIIWFAMDFSDDEEPIRFKSAEIAENFKEKFEEAMTTSPSPKKETPSVAEEGSDTPTLSSVNSGSSRQNQKHSEDNEDVIFLKEEKATPRQVELARRFFLPDNFYLYENRPPCPGCRGCVDDDTSSSTAGKLCISELYTIEPVL